MLYKNNISCLWQKFEKPKMLRSDQEKGLAKNIPKTAVRIFYKYDRQTTFCTLFRMYQSFTTESPNFVAKFIFLNACLENKT